jgi:LPS export ABC transporter protein LptC
MKYFGGAGFFMQIFLCVSCSFNYSDAAAADDNQPDIIMERVEHTRFRDGNMQLRFSAAAARRYEKAQIMELDDFYFEQYNREEESDASGSGGRAVVELKQGNVHISDGVRLRLESEDLQMETPSLDWKDKERILEGAEGAVMHIERTDGTMMEGKSFSADVRRKTWEFGDGIEGIYVHEDEDESGGEDPPGEEQEG